MINDFNTKRQEILGALKEGQGHYLYGDVLKKIEWKSERSNKIPSGWWVTWELKNGVKPNDTILSSDEVSLHFPYIMIR